MRRPKGIHVPIAFLVLGFADGPIAGSGEPAFTASVGNLRALVGRSPRGASPSAATEGPIAAVPFTNLPDAEIPIAASFPTVGNRDLQPQVFGRSTGEVAVLGLDDFRAWSRKSTNGGATFAAEVPVGGPGAPETHAFDAQLSSDGRLYVALIVVGPAGGAELRATRSDDMGATWTSPVVVVSEGSDAFSVFGVRIATGPSGRAAMIFLGHDGTRVYASVTIDSGATWTSPRRIDASAPTGAYFPYFENAIDVAVDGANRILAVFAQNRGTGDTVFFTRSTDDGATFAPETAVTLAAHASSANPDLEIANDGNGLLALWDDDGGDYVYVLRSTTGGASWATVLTRSFATDSNAPLRPRLSADPAVGAAFLHYIEPTNAVSVSRSTTSGATWNAPFALASTGAGNGLDRPFGRTEMKRTAPGNWVVAWEDQRADTYARLRTDVYARASTNDGLSYGTESRVDTGSSAGSNGSELSGMTAHSTNNVYLVYVDGRDESGRGTNIYGNRSTVPLSFGTDVRLDADADARQPTSGSDRSVASDGGTHAYVAFRSRASGHFSDIYVASSADSGATFGAPVRVGDAAPGTRINLGPVLRALPGGRVYLVYQSDNGSGSREFRFNRSSDYGATWQATDFVLGTAAQPAQDVDDFFQVPRLEATADGTVYVVWSVGGQVLFRRSSDFGATWGTTSDIDQNSNLTAVYQTLCASGERVIVTFADLDSTGNAYTIYATVSENRGAAWSPRTNVRQSTGPLSLFLYDTGCGPEGTASVVWQEDRTGTLVEPYSVRFDGTSWTAPAVVPTGTSNNGYMVDTEFVSSTVALAVYEDLVGAIWVSRSTDGGATFPSRMRLDDATPRPDAASLLPILAIDASGNAWVRFFDRSVGGLSHAVARTSGDGGVTWSAVRRVESYEPQGAREDDYASTYAPGKAIAALPGIGLFAWGGQRASQTFDVLFNRWALGPQDADGDGEPATTDCDDGDPGVRAVPVEVTAARVEEIAGGARLTWTSQDGSAGPATAYDVVTGALADLRTTGGFAQATCLQGAHPDTPYDDLRPDPAPGSGWYYLLRAKNVCGAATFGISRGSLDASSPCP